MRAGFRGPQVYTELHKVEGEQVHFALPKVKLEAPVLVKPT